MYHKNLIQSFQTSAVIAPKQMHLDFVYLEVALNISHLILLCILLYFLFFYDKEKEAVILTDVQCCLTQVLIIGTFLKSQPEVANCKWSCMFGEVEVPAEVLANGILCCLAPPHQVGRVPFYVTCSNRVACSEVREFDYREGFAKEVDVTDIYSNSFEMLLYLRLEDLLSLKSVHPSNGKSFDNDTDKRNLIYKLISLKEEEEYSNKEEQTLDMDLSQQKVKEHLFHRQAKEKLYSWLLHKVAEDGKGSNVLDEEGQGVLHLAAALGYDWAIVPIVISGVNINFRDVNGWTALHWAASCGR